jgi:hypothetical protein
MKNELNYRGRTGYERHFIVNPRDINASRWCSDITDLVSSIYYFIGDSFLVD